jgi:hypothetical protein
MIVAITTAGWIFIGIVGGLFLWIVLRLVWMFGTNQPLDQGCSFGKDMFWWRRKRDRDIMGDD